MSLYRDRELDGGVCITKKDVETPSAFQYLGVIWQHAINVSMRTFDISFRCFIVTLTMLASIMIINQSVFVLQTQSERT